MKMVVCACLDKKVNAFLAPAFFRTKGEATRSFSDAVVATPNIKSHPEDYSFWFLGFWEDGEGTFTSPANGPEPLMTALDCIVVEGSLQ